MERILLRGPQIPLFRLPQSNHPRVSLFGFSSPPIEQEPFGFPHPAPHLGPTVPGYPTIAPGPLPLLIKIPAASYKLPSLFARYGVPDIPAPAAPASGYRRLSAASEPDPSQYYNPTAPGQACS